MEADNPEEFTFINESSQQNSAFEDDQNDNFDDQNENYETEKLETRSIELIPCEEDETAPLGITSMQQMLSSNKEIVELQKELMQREHNQLKQMRIEKHQMELSLLKTEIAHRTLEHQKRMEILEKKHKVADKVDVLTSLND